MKPQEAVKQIKNGQGKGYIILAGEDDYRKKYTLKQIIAALQVEMPEMNLSEFEERPDTQSVLRAMETMPFLAAHRITILKNTDILGTQASGDLSAPFCKSNMPDCNYFIVVAQGNADKRKAYVKFVMQQGMFVECGPMQERELLAFVIQYAKHCNLLISAKNAQTLIDLSSGDINAIQNELDKLSVICRGEISAADIEAYAIKSMQYNVYKIHDFMVAGRPGQAYGIIQKMLEEDPNPIGFITLLSNNFRQMLVARACRDAHFPDSKTISHIMEATGAREFAARRALDHCKAFTASSIRRAILMFAKMDYSAKQGIIIMQTDLYALLVDIYRGDQKEKQERKKAGF
ncbi:MAG: DNA polymerase III subunit delta [Christensenella sp.]|nr:DNA polymerase III subunit delta [Christensenella sp.]